jgi:hypothetical protein
MLLYLWHIKLSITFQGYKYYYRVPNNGYTTCTYKNTARIPSKISEKTSLYCAMLHNEKMEDYDEFFL